MTTRPVMYNGYQIGTAEVDLVNGAIVFTNVLLDETPGVLKEGMLTGLSIEDDEENLIDCE